MWSSGVIDVTKGKETKQGNLSLTGECLGVS